MPQFLPAAPPHIRALLEALADPPGCRALSDDEWDLLVRVARSARLLGTLSARIQQAGILDQIPEPVANHLRAATAESLYLRQMSLRELTLIGETLQPLQIPVVVLKGSAYILSKALWAAGRMPRDIDLMVERGRLDEAERALLAAGWEFTKTEAYDQRYYREWSHELPPMRAPTLPLELDLHHTILPPIGRLRPDASRLIADSVPLAGSMYRILRPADQVLHAAAHLFQDSDCVGKLRDLVDIDGLLRDFAARVGDPFWRALLESAELHRLGRPLWYALAFARSWTATPVPAGVWEEADRFCPPFMSRAAFLPLAGRVLGPVHPDCEADATRRSAASALELRSQWLRMPPWLLVYHSASKWARSKRKKPAKPEPA